MDQETDIDFIQNHIMCRFGVPETITTDQGTIFTGRKMQDFTKECGIKLLTLTPYYAQANVLPVKIQVHAVRIQRQHEIPSEDYWNMIADELVDLDEERMGAFDSLQRQKERVSRAYNKKVKDKTFAVDDLVWKVILPMDRNDRVFGKWSPK
ncbi:uncharacterized protein LOC131637975 [Vicia villosa]|uniref:uncharacterized protein LOC131637975 n=1 Tax=Vicia villosa TaxID=3911 RepID=UPI00273BFA90|nr:uncharacterized protein LOC131637975 [Vicia villosa]